MSTLSLKPTMTIAADTIGALPSSPQVQPISLSLSPASLLTPTPVTLWGGLPLCYWSCFAICKTKKGLKVYILPYFHQGGP